VRKDETFFVQSGEMVLEIGTPPNVERRILAKNESFHCAPGTVHRMVAEKDVDVVEVSTPDLDDVVRLEDDYGRKGTSKA
jgi:mannose-6-phosphate isomerase-like protein (cupin superfamily)